MIPCVLFILFIKISRVYLLYLVYSLNLIEAAITTSQSQYQTTLIESQNQSESTTISTGIYSSLSPTNSKSAPVIIADFTNGQPSLPPPLLTSSSSTLATIQLFDTKNSDGKDGAHADARSTTSQLITNEKPLHESGSSTTSAITNDTNTGVSHKQLTQLQPATQASLEIVSDKNAFTNINEDETSQVHNLSDNNSPTNAPSTRIIPFASSLHTSKTTAEQQPIQSHGLTGISPGLSRQVHQLQRDPESQQKLTHDQHEQGTKQTFDNTKEKTEVTSELLPTVSDNGNNNDYSESDDTTSTTTVTTSANQPENIQNNQHQTIKYISHTGTTPTIFLFDPKVTSPVARYRTSESDKTYIPPSAASPINDYYSQQPSLVISNIPIIDKHNFPVKPDEIVVDTRINKVDFSNHDYNNKNLSATSNSNFLPQIETPSNGNITIATDARSVCVTAAYLCVIFVNKTFDECDQNLCSSKNVETSRDIHDEETLQQAINRMLQEKFAVVDLKSDIHPLLYRQEAILTYSQLPSKEKYSQNDDKPSIYQWQQQKPPTVMIVKENKHQQQHQEVFKPAHNNQIFTPMYTETKVDHYSNERYRHHQTTITPMQTHNPKVELQQQVLNSDSIFGWIPITFPPISSLGLFSFPSSSYPSNRLRHVDPLYPHQHLNNQLRIHNGQVRNMMLQQESQPSQEFYLDFPSNDNTVGLDINGEEKVMNEVKTVNEDGDNAMSSSTTTRILRPNKQPQIQMPIKYESVSTTLSELLSGSMMHSPSAPLNMISSNNDDIDTSATNEGSNKNKKPIQLVPVKNKNLNQQTKHRLKLQPQTSSSVFSSIGNQATKITAINFLGKNSEVIPQSEIAEGDTEFSTNANKCQASNENLSTSDSGIINCDKCDTTPTSGTSVHSNQASVSIKSLPIEVTFTLYTRYNWDLKQNQNEASAYNEDVLDLNNDTTIEQSHLNKSYPIKIIVHGFGSGGKRPWVMDMAYKLLDFDKVNVIVVDWEKGAVLPNYVQAASNTRFVGHRIACLIKKINSKFGLTGDNYHLIGFSLGAHVAGHAGMEIRNSTNNIKHWINRITGLDPASPLFEGYDAYHRLDPSDAQFVDVIHSNGDGVLRGGLGSLQPMGHVDFYPNGGRVQVGCNSVIVSALSDIIYGKWQTLCNHRRALNFFMDTLETNSCKFRSFNCESYESYLRGECFECGFNHDKCSEMGYSTNRTEGRGKMYLTTSETGPFCANQFVIKLIGTSGYSTYWGKVEVVLLTSDGKNETYLLSATNQHVGDDSNDEYVGHVQSLIVAQSTLYNFTHALLRYTRYKGWIYSGQENWSIDKLYITDSEGQVKSYCGHNTLLGSQLLTKLRLESHNCTIETASSNTKQQLSSSSPMAVSQHPITTRSGRFFWLGHGSTNSHASTNAW